jgi:RimJ/RimL family protein N-acetyltransferase
MNTLHAPPLVLEPQVAAHAREMFAVLIDPAIYEFENEPPASEDSLAARYAKLESRRSPDGSQAWLNWVVRLPSGTLAGYVQATVLAGGTARVAYELGSAHWRRGIGSKAVAAVLAELRDHHAVTLAAAVLKARNHRSLGLLRKLGFEPASGELRERFHPDPDEAVMVLPTRPN